jgi:hypothetical protein
VTADEQGTEWRPPLPTQLCMAPAHVLPCGCSACPPLYLLLCKPPVHLALPPAVCLLDIQSILQLFLLSVVSQEYVFLHPFHVSFHFIHFTILFSHLHFTDERQRLREVSSHRKLTLTRPTPELVLLPLVQTPLSCPEPPEQQDFILKTHQPFYQILPFSLAVLWVVGLTLHCELFRGWIYFYFHIPEAPPVVLCVVSTQVNIYHINSYHMNRNYSLVKML